MRDVARDVRAGVRRRANASLNRRPDGGTPDDVKKPVTVDFNTIEMIRNKPGMKRDDHHYLTIVVAALMVVAVGFSFAPRQTTDDQQDQSDAAGNPVEIRSPKTFGAKVLDDPTAFFTMALALLTTVLAATATGQIYYLRRTDKTARRSADAAFKAAEAAERSSIVAENALIGAEAPFIFATAESVPFRAPSKLNGQNDYASLTLHNYGRSPAIVRDIYLGTILCAHRPASIGFPPPHSALHKVEVIPPGKSNEPLILKQVDFAFSGGGEYATRPRDGIHWIIGQVRYTDAFGTQYLTGFCFALNRSTDKFQCHGGTAYNYRRRLNEDERSDAENEDAERPHELVLPPAGS